MLSLVFAVVPTSAFLESRIPLLSSDNYFDWKEQILLNLDCMELDLTLCMDESLTLTDTSMPKERANYQQWE